MVLHDFECSKGHIFESTIDSNHVTAKIRCTFTLDNKRCRAMASVVYLSPRLKRMARTFAPSLLFVNEVTGDVIVPGRNDKTLLPKNYLNKLGKDGYKEVNITTIREYEKFRRTRSDREGSQAAIYQQLEQEVYDKSAREALDFMKHGGNVMLPDKRGRLREVYIPPVDKLDHPQVKALAEHAMKELQGHRVSIDRSDPFIHAFEHDNLKYSDRDTDWKQRG